MRLDECQIANALIERLVVEVASCPRIVTFHNELLSRLIVVRHSGLTAAFKNYV